MTIYQTSDLAANRVRFLNDARKGRATLRDKDGTSLVMLPETTLTVLEDFAEWSGELSRLQSLLERTATPSVADLGKLAWLRPFDRDDLQEFADDLHSALIASLADKSSEVLDECIREWRITAQQLEDPLRRSVLLGGLDALDYSEVGEPSGVDD